MWPFRKGLDLRGYGFKTDQRGNASFDFTDEERREIDSLFRVFEKMAIHKDYVDAVQRATTARALSQYAKGQIELCELESKRSDRSKMIAKAVSACFKACNIYPLPIFDYDLACLLEMAGESAQADAMFRKFLAEQATFKPGQIDEMFLKERDIEAAIRDARARVGA